MTNTPSAKTSDDSRTVRVLVWDLPTRLFHWLLLLCVIISFVTGNIGGNAMRYHMLSGYVILALLIFRLVWGFAGSRTSRFAAFVKGPASVLSYIAAILKKDEPLALGHNPLGGWSIVAMLADLFVQVGTGLFASDDILTQGPLYGWVARDTANFLTGVHLANRYVLVALIAIHIFAVMFYLFVKHENLIRPMITGIKDWHTAAEPAAGRSLPAAIVFGLAAIAVYLLVR
jgi:cytochrome b